MKKHSHFSLPEINKQFKKYRLQLQQNVTSNGNQKALVRTYAGSFPAVNFTLKRRYVRKLKRVYGADAQTEPYRTNPQKAQNDLNE